MLQQTIRDLIPAVAPLGRGARRGCAFVLDAERAVALTHTLRSEEVEVRIAGARIAATVTGADELSGVSLLAGDFSSVSSPGLAPAAAELGQEIYSLADPGSALRVTRGEVSCTGLVIRTRSGRPGEMFEHTASVPAGAGGGAVADGEGRVLGISALRGDAGFVLAIPSARVLAAVERIAAGRHAPRLGVALALPRVARRMRAAVGLSERPGLLVRVVQEGSPAERAGVRAGDLLVGLAGADLDSLDALFAALERSAAGEGAPLQIVRGEEELELLLDFAGEGSPA